MNLRSIGKDRHLKDAHERRLNMQNLQNDIFILIVETWLSISLFWFQDVYKLKFGELWMF
jgi:hypothetical protein